jgi:hypothetical protein
MSTFDAARLLALLPAVYRFRDAEQEGFDRLRGGPLQALLAVIAEEIAVVEESIAQLYDDQFIETCADWVVPYIGDLVGHRALALTSSVTRFSTSRAEVANTITYRRSKGTAAILEQLARDVTGWPARLEEYFQRLAISQWMNHVRPDAAVLDLRRMQAVERLGTPFETAPRTLEVRRIASGRGRYNVPNAGITLWRLATYDVEASAPRPDASAPGTRFRFNPLGLDAPLFTPPRVEADPLGAAADVDLPEALPRRALARELDARRAALVNGDDVVRHFFADDAPFAVSVPGVGRVPDEEVLICDLSTWSAAPATRSYRRRSDGAMVARPIGVAVDPVLGRFVLPAAVDPQAVRASYTYAFPAELGGGPYDRSGSVAAWLDPVRRPVTWQIGVTSDPAALASSNPPHSEIVDTLAAAVNAWKAHVTAAPGAFGVIAVMDSASHVASLTGADRIEVPAGSRLAIVAAAWPRVDAAGPGGPYRPPGLLAADGLRPHLLGDVSVAGTTAPDEPLPDGGSARRLPGELILDGLLIEGQLRVLVGDLGGLELRHTTLAPPSAGITVNGSVQPDLQNATLVLRLERAITGSLTLPDSVPSLVVRDTIVDGSIAAPGAQLDISTSTVTGPVGGLRLDASDALFIQPVTIAHRQLGCVRFSFVPAASGTPRRYRCQPDLVVKLGDPALADIARRRVTPVFTSLRFGDPGYGQLARRCAPEIRTGASNGAEMGALNLLEQPRRETNLRLRLREHLRVGLEAGIFYRN